MKVKKDSLQDVVRKYSLMKLAPGSWVVVFDPVGKRFKWCAERLGLYGVDLDRSTSGATSCTVWEMKFGEQYAERGGPAYRRFDVETLWNYDLPRALKFVDRT